MNGTSCSHKFHWECAMVWLTKPKKPKDHCPYCREQMITPNEMKATALEVLGEDRVKELMAKEQALNRNRISSSGANPISDNQNQNSIRVRATNDSNRNSNPVIIDVEEDGEYEV